LFQRWLRMCNPLREGGAEPPLRTVSVNQLAGGGRPSGFAVTSALAVVFGLLAVTPHAARGAPGRTVSAHGVTVWLSQSRFQGDMTFVKEQVWQAVSLDELSRPFGGDPVIASETLLAAFDSTKGCVSVYTRKGGRLEKRGVVRLDPVRRPVVYAVVAGDAHRGVGIEVRSASATASRSLPSSVRKAASWR